MSTPSGRRWAGALLVLAVLLALSVWTGLAVGPSGLGLGDAAQTELAARIVWRYRAPRVAAAALVGASLASAGLALQALLRNPLADPFILGLSGGAVAGASLLLLGGGAAFGWSVSAGAFGGALAVALAIGLGARRWVEAGGAGLLLIGVVINAICGAWAQWLTYVAEPGLRLRVLAWLSGSLAAAHFDTTTLLVSATAAAAVWMWLAWVGRDLNLLLLGDEVATSLGVRVGRLRRGLFVGAALTTALAVALSGLVGFVGLIVPHLLRLVLGPDHRLLVPASVLGGAAALVAADTAARTLWAPSDLPVGIVTALAGGPFFLWLLVRGSSARAETLA